MLIKIRPARIEDLPAIVNIYNQAVNGGIATDDDQPISVVDRQAWFNQFNQHYPIWVAENSSNNICGWCSIKPFLNHPAYNQSAELAIYIANNVQHHGIGQMLLRHVDKAINSRLDFHTVVAYIYERNIPSQRLFLKCGYHYWGHLPNIAKINKELRTLEIFGKNY